VQIEICGVTMTVNPSSGKNLLGQEPMVPLSYANEVYTDKLKKLEKEQTVAKRAIRKMQAKLDMARESENNSKKKAQLLMDQNDDLKQSFSRILFEKLSGFVEPEESKDERSKSSTDSKELFGNMEDLFTKSKPQSKYNSFDNAKSVPQSGYISENSRDDNN